jgi:hypothetical protein
MDINPNQILTGINGTNANIGHVSRAVPGLQLSAFRIGEFQISPMGKLGTIVVEVVTGVAPASPEVLVSLRDTRTSPQNEVLITLDSSNRPGMKIVVAGTTVAEWTPGGAVIATGAPIKLKLVWDSRTPLSTGLYASFTDLYGAVLGGSWGTLPSAVWSFNPMSMVLSGWAPTLLDFNGPVIKTQVGNLL